MFVCFFNYTATTEICTLSLHDALPIFDSVFDTLIRHGERVFFKADVEGWTREVLGGADISLDRVAGLQLELAVEPSFEGERSEEHTSELQSRQYLVCRLLLEKKTHS